MVTSISQPVIEIRSDTGAGELFHFKEGMDAGLYSGYLHSERCTHPKNGLEAYLHEFQDFRKPRFHFHAASIVLCVVYNVLFVRNWVFALAKSLCMEDMFEGLYHPTYRIEV